MDYDDTLRMGGGAQAAIIGTPGRMARGLTLTGFAIIALFLATALGWATRAPLAGGAVATGSIAPDGSVRTIQHLEGGIVQAIYVREGDFVEEGAPLLALERVASQADVEALLDRRRARTAEAARLQAEIAQASTISFPVDLTEDADAAPIIEAEERLFEAGRAMNLARERVLRQRINQLSEQILGFEAQVASADQRVAITEEEISYKGVLLEKGLTPRSELANLRQSLAEFQGFGGEYRAEIARARERVGETEIELLALEAELLQAASKRAGEVRGELAEIEQQLAARRDILDRTLISAPMAGVINNLAVKTIGGVVGPGQQILELVPTEERLVIDVQVSPSDIDVVKVGLPAIVHLTAIAGRSSPRLHGRVSAVSANPVLDEVTRQTYYSARVEVAKEELRAAAAPTLTVGMPADVTVVSQDRSVFDYVMQPLTDSIRRAGKEM